MSFAKMCYMNILLYYFFTSELKYTILEYLKFKTQNIIFLTLLFYRTNHILNYAIQMHFYLECPMQHIYKIICVRLCSS